MAADTKREVDPRALCGVFQQFLDDKSLTVDWLGCALAAQGLHVVTAAEVAVLDACEKATLHKWEGRDAIGSDSLAAIIATIVARRVAAK